MFQDSNTYNRVTNILERLNSNKPFSINGICKEMNEIEKNIESDIKKLREIEYFPIKNEYDEYSFNSDFIGLLNEAHINIIATSLATHKINPEYDYKLTIQNILRSLKYGIYALPQRKDYKYIEIEHFESYELSYCVANEMAIRNYKIADKIKKFYYKNELKSKLSYKKLVNYLEKNQIVEELKDSYWISVYHTEIDLNGDLRSIEYSKNQNYDPFSYNNYPIDSYLKEFSNFNNNQKHKQEVYDLIDYRNLFSDRNPDGFKFSQETIKDGNYYSSIKPDFHRKILDPNLVSVPLNFSLPKEELIEYISRIKDFLYPDEQKSNNQRQVLTVKELIHKDKYNEHKKSKRFPVKIKAKRIADYLYIYDYVIGRLGQLKNDVLQEQTNKFNTLLEKHKKIQNEFLFQIDLKSFEEKTINKFDLIFKSLNSKDINNKDLLKKQYQETLKLYSIYYIEEQEHVNASNIINLFLKDIEIINNERFDLFYKISAIYFYIIEEYKHLKKEIKRIKNLSTFKNKKISERKKLYRGYYLKNKKSVYTILKGLKQIRNTINPKNFKNFRQTEFVNIEEEEEGNYAYEEYIEQYSEKNERLQIESILSEKYLLKQLKLSDSTILDYYYAIRPYIENFNYKNLLSGIDTPEEIKPLNEKIKDARKLPKEKQQQIRYEAIKYLEEGKLSVKNIARKVGVHSSRIYEWKNQYEKNKSNNLDYLKIKSRGRKENETLLNEKEQKTIIKYLIATNPTTFYQESYLWNIETTKILIKYMFNKNISSSAIRIYLKKWNLLVEHKDFIIINQIVEDFATKQWIDITYPTIQNQAKEENAEIWWTNGIFGKINTHDKLRVLTAAKGKKSFFSIFQIDNDKSIQNISNFLEFLENILKYSEKKKYILIYACTNDYLKTLEQWEKEKKDKVKLVTLYTI